MISLSDLALSQLCPMHLSLDDQARIRHMGPTLASLTKEAQIGRPVHEVIEFLRPRAEDGLAGILACAGRKMHMRLRQGPGTALKGQVLPAEGGGALLNLGFGIGVVEAVREYSLTAHNFAPTDLAIDMLYLVEAKSMAMEASHRLNLRLQGAMHAAEERAFTDTLTGLPNRRAADSMLARLCRADHRFALLQVDLDHFKEVNDTLGHAAGDHVLQVVSHAMNDAVRRDDLVARLGGDEFLIILKNYVSSTRLQELAEQVIRCTTQPVHYAGQTCQIGCSIGIALVGEEASPEVAMQQVDKALYAAKHAGRGQFAFYSEEADSGLGPLPRQEKK